MFFRSLVSLLLGLIFIISSVFVRANNSDSTTIGISVVVPERAENQKCTIGFENSLDGNITAMQSSGCHFNSKKLLQTAYQQATKKNSQGFVTVLITAP